MGAETENIKKLQKKLSIMQHAMEQKIVKATLRERKTAKWIMEQTQVADILVDFKLNKWSWAGHLMCRTENTWTIKQQHRYQGRGNALDEDSKLDGVMKGGTQG